jgi:hypothetical protein
MEVRGPFDLLLDVVAVLDELQFVYALGGSLASSLVGEPRTTLDVDIVVVVNERSVEPLLERLAKDLYVPVDIARSAVRSGSSFNVIDVANGIKADLFVAGSGILDQSQIERRVRVQLPGADDGIWVTSPEDQVLRKLDWYRLGGRVSDRQWRDVVGIIRAQAGSLDRVFLRDTAQLVDLLEDLDAAIAEAGTGGSPPSAEGGALEP